VALAARCAGSSAVSRSISPSSAGAAPEGESSENRA
jgi:hypothetical protein